MKSNSDIEGIHIHEEKYMEGKSYFQYGRDL